MEEIRAMIAKALATLKTRALSGVANWFDRFEAENEKNSELEDIDAEDEEKSEDEDIQSEDELDTTDGVSIRDKASARGLRSGEKAETFTSEYGAGDFTTTSTPARNLGDWDTSSFMSQLIPDSKMRKIFSSREYPSEKEREELRTGSWLGLVGEDYTEDEDEDTGKDEIPKENTNDSGLGTSGITTSPQSKKTDCNILKNNSISSNPNDAVSRQEQAVSDNSDALEWKPLRPKWHYKKDPRYFHCHQDSPELCYHCSLQWGRDLDEGRVWDGEDWV